MSISDIKDFYSFALEQKKFSPKFWNELRKISTENELKSFIEGKVQPVAKKMGYDFSTAELLSYEEKVAKEITERQLEAVSGGVNVKNLALGGIISLMAIGAGVVGATSSASAELSTKEISGSSKMLETEIDKEIKVTKITEKSKEDKNLDQKQDDKEQNEEKREIKATKSWYGQWLYLNTNSDSLDDLNLNSSDLNGYAKKAGFGKVEEIQAIQAKNSKGEILEVKLDENLKGLFSESQDVPGTLWGTWGKANTKKEVPDLKVVKEASSVNQSKIVETKKLTD